MDTSKYTFAIPGSLWWYVEVRCRVSGDPLAFRLLATHHYRGLGVLYLFLFSTLSRARRRRARIGMDVFFTVEEVPLLYPPQCRVRDFLNHGCMLLFSSLLWCVNRVLLCGRPPFAFLRPHQLCSIAFNGRQLACG
jgi:hypothetical protein